MSALLTSVAASVKSGFHPKDLEGAGIELRGWFDPRDVRQMDIASGRITTFRNKVTGVAASEVSSSGPLLGFGLNGGPCMASSDGTYLVSTEAALLDLWTGDSGFATHTIVCLWQINTNATISPFGAARSDDTTNDSHSYGPANTAGQPLSFQSGRLGPDPEFDTTVYISGANTGSFAPVVAAYRYDGSNVILRVDGADVPLTILSGGTNWPVNPNRFALCALPRSTPQGYFLGNVGPVLMYRGAMGDAACDSACQGVKRWYGMKF